MSDDDVSGMWREMRRDSQQRRAQNREYGPKLLEQAGIPFESHNNGAHLIVGFQGYLYDYWPGTGYWKSRESSISRRGVRKLIARIEHDRQAIPAQNSVKERHD